MLDLGSRGSVSYLCSENKGADQLCALVFAYAESRFPHDAANIR